MIAGDTPAEIEENYMTLTGKPPMMPEYGMGFWQCKLRYWNQEQLLSVARKYKELGVPLDVIVVDFFHWTKQGEFKFDPKYWPDVPGMCRELKEMGIQVVVSVWPTVDIYSENFEEMKEKGYLVRTEHGVPLTMLCGGNEVFFDATNPDARTYVWEKIKKNLLRSGCKTLLAGCGRAGIQRLRFQELPLSARKRTGGRKYLSEILSESVL